MLRVIKTTADGSPTIYIPELKEHYHSVHGAIQESEFIFIERALRRRNGENIKLLEIGLGTGLNAFLTCMEAEKKRQNICYHSVELYPVEKDLYEEIGKFFSGNEYSKSIFMQIHDCEWDKETDIGSFFRLKKIKADIRIFSSSIGYDVVYFDAFGPEVQPFLWTAEIFKNIAEMMNPGAILATYSAKGQVGRNMRQAGLTVERMPGPPGKREIIVASKPLNPVL